MSKREPIKTITTTLDGRMERVNVCPAAEVRNLEADYAELEKQRDELLTVGEKMLGEFEKVTGYTYLPFDLLLTRIKEDEK